MRTSEELYHQVRWDPRFDPARFVLGINVRGAEPKRVPLSTFVPGGDIPWHRILFVEADGELVWDRSTGVDRIDSSRAGRRRDPRRLRAASAMARTPFRWRPRTGWGPVDVSPAPPAAPGAPAPMRVLTWNTLWDRYDSDRIDTARRRPLLLDALQRAGADVIALQEVESGLLDLLLRARWVRDGYTLSTDPAGGDVETSGLLLLSRLPVREAARHVLGPHKAVAAVTVDSAGGPVVVACTHLTSDHAENGPARREAELAMIVEVLAGVDGDVVLLGDFNDGGSRPAAALGLRDAWSEVHGAGDTTATFDPKANPLAALNSLSGRASRLDRVLLRGPGLRAMAAALRGDAPATSDGLYVSDHYGVAVDLAVDPGADRAADHAVGEGAYGSGGVSAGPAGEPPTVRTAVAWVPPEELWPPIQEIRERHDPQIGRWPPHVNVMFGFVAESSFAEAVPLLAATLADILPFTARLDGVRVFPHGDHATVWLDPAAADARPWAALRAAVERAFPGCGGRADGYTPHLTLGRVGDAERFLAGGQRRLGGMSALVGELVLLSRRGGEPMRPRAAVALGTGEVRWLDPRGKGDRPEPEAATGDAGGDRVENAAGGAAGRVAARLRDSLSSGSGRPAGGLVHIAGSRRMGCAPPGADLDLVAVLPGADLAMIEDRVRSALPDATGIRHVIGARVPGIRLRAGGLDVDLVVVDPSGIPPAEAVARRAELGEAAAVALSAVSDADAVLAAVDADRARFVRLAVEVKTWARARGLDSAPFGGLPGLAWTVLAARTVREAGDVPPGDLLAHFFGTWAAWDWRDPVALRPDPPVPRSAGAVTIMTPTHPVRSCTEQVRAGGRDLLVQELYEAWETVTAAAAAGREPWADLLSAPPLHRRHAAWAIVTVRAGRGEEPGVTLGRFRGRVRALLGSLERAGTPDAHAWPRPFETGPESARFAIGLGRTPPDAAGLAAVAGPWAGELRGVDVRWAAGGDVPTLGGA